MFRRHMSFAIVLYRQLVIALVRQHVVFCDRFVGAVLGAVEFNNLILQFLLFPEVEYATEDNYEHQNADDDT